MARRAVSFLVVLAACLSAGPSARAYNNNPWHLLGFGDAAGVHVELDSYGMLGLPVRGISAGTGSVTIVHDSSFEKRSLVYRCVDVTGDAEPETLVAGVVTDSSGADWSFRIRFYESQTTEFGIYPGTDENSCETGSPWHPNGVGTFTVNAPLI